MWVSGLWTSGNLPVPPSAGRDASMVNGEECRQASQTWPEDYFLRSVLCAVRHGMNPIRFIPVRRIYGGSKQGYPHR